MSRRGKKKVQCKDTKLKEKKLFLSTYVHYDKKQLPSVFLLKWVVLHSFSMICVVFPWCKLELFLWYFAFPFFCVKLVVANLFHLYTLDKIMLSIAAILCFSYCFTWELICSVTTHVELRFQLRSIQRHRWTRRGDLCCTPHSVAVTHARQRRTFTSYHRRYSFQSLLVFTALIFPRTLTLSAIFLKWFLRLFFSTRSWVEHNFSQILFDTV